MGTFGLVYTVGAVFLILTTMGAAMSGFEPGTKPVGPMAWRALSTLTEMVMLPFGPLFTQHGTRGLWGYAIIYANGVAWGTMVLVSWTVLRRTRRNHPEAA